jgi:uncharacterized repeat protein (TIGR03803 family)
MRSSSVFFSTLALTAIGLFSPTLPARAAPVETVLYNFVAGHPSGGITVDAAGVLYGTTDAGGAAGYNDGGVFALRPPAAGKTKWTQSILYEFKNPSRGRGPSSGTLIFDAAGNLYGTDQNGGVRYCETTGEAPATVGCGLVFKLSPPASKGSGWTETTIYSFCGEKGQCADGQFPSGSLSMNKSGQLFGSSNYINSVGVTASNVGTFELMPPTSAKGRWSSGPLLRFLGIPIIDPQGALYGDLGIDVIGKLSPPAPGQTAWTLSETFSFSHFNNPAGGYEFSGALLYKDGALYGTTLLGGTTSAACPVSCGVVFRLTQCMGPNGLTFCETVLHRFQGGADGNEPMGLTAGSDGALYGTTMAGGETMSAGGRIGAKGILFKLTPPRAGKTTWTETVLHSFAGPPTDGEYPTTSPTVTADGTIYGMTARGGANKGGVIYRVTQ